MCFITLPPRSNGYVKISRFCFNSVYLITRREVGPICASMCSTIRITFHQLMSSPRQTQRAVVSTTHFTILIQTEFTVYSCCLGRTGRRVQMQIGLRLFVCVCLCATDWEKRLEVVVFVLCVCTMVRARGSSVFMSCCCRLNSSPLTKVHTLKWLMGHIYINTWISCMKILWIHMINVAISTTGLDSIR